ncbi:MAG: hypothetical protein LC749_01655, partial [Actinobacteria bacterium]|nr:hypothetical protein [Actinomycetota bacterium]
MTVSPSNPYSAVPTGSCLVCGDPISYQVRGRPRLYCERVRCRRRGARRRALATAWEEGRAVARMDFEAAAAASAGPTYEDGLLAGQELGRSEAIHMVQALVDTGAEFIKERNAPAFLALDLAVIKTRRWLDARRE